MHRLRALLLVLVGVAAVVAVPAPAQAASSYPKCSGWITVDTAITGVQGQICLYNQDWVFQTKFWLRNQSSSNFFIRSMHADYVQGSVTPRICMQDVWLHAGTTT
ncbi:hypothetical protein E1258_13060 [Micromonospora sp. KC207]|uniref:hypothetical protein n=1 Tax=Micromonospora sp. KC207 TaxID=2530377 RepID=UPI0010464AC4|nr:hypothetical protein [Micromonospora sp. KC207]TDC60960.1 hypothetical protein E1258_13060 [Micromonospora sp. KC207]